MQNEDAFAGDGSGQDRDEVAGCDENEADEVAAEETENERNEDEDETDEDE